MRPVLKAIGGLVAAFAVQMVLNVVFYRAVGQRMLETAGWTPGTRPPTPYMTATVVVALIAAAVAGVLAALIVGRARLHHGLAYGILLSALGIWGNRSTLFGDPHPYEWPLVLAPLIGLPLGAWLIARLTPLPAPEGGPSVAA